MGQLVKIITCSMFIGTCSPQSPVMISQNFIIERPAPTTTTVETASYNIAEKNEDKEQSKCPENMVSIEDEYCIDRWEASIVDKKSGEPAAPQYIASFSQSAKQYSTFLDLEVDDEKLKEYFDRIKKEFLRLKKPVNQKEEDIYNFMESMPKRGSESTPGFEPKAVCLQDVKPASYVSRDIAWKACDNAGKRLCTSDEWYQACVGPNGPKPFFNKKGEKEFPDAYPYGDRYKKGKCNIGFLRNKMWPPGLLGRKNNWQMTDPRISNLLGLDGEPMIEQTGSFSGCTSNYGVYDLVGSVHEIVTDFKEGKFKRATFMGSHFARDSRQSCGEITQGHWFGYTDYSIGFRCCSDTVDYKPK